MSSYNFFKTTDIESSKAHMHETIVFRGGSLEAKNGLLIDGKLYGTTIDSKDGSPIYVSALAELDDCVINGVDVLIEGSFSGTLNASGKTEFASGCVAVGVFNKGEEVYIHKLADLDDLKLSSKKVKAMSIVSSEPEKVIAMGAKTY
jgi:cytoskeletal protein CcmA (bactofilin family)